MVGKLKPAKRAIVQLNTMSRCFQDIATCHTPSETVVAPVCGQFPALLSTLLHRGHIHDALPVSVQRDVRSVSLGEGLQTQPPASSIASLRTALIAPGTTDDAVPPIVSASVQVETARCIPMPGNER